MDFLGVCPLDECGKPNEVGEENRDQFSFRHHWTESWETPTPFAGNGGGDEMAASGTETRAGRQLLLATPATGRERLPAIQAESRARKIGCAASFTLHNINCAAA